MGHIKKTHHQILFVFVLRHSSFPTIFYIFMQVKHVNLKRDSLIAFTFIYLGLFRKSLTKIPLMKHKQVHIRKLFIWLTKSYTCVTSPTIGYEFESYNCVCPNNRSFLSKCGVTAHRSSFCF